MKERQEQNKNIYLIICGPDKQGYVYNTLSFLFGEDINNNQEFLDVTEAAVMPCFSGRYINKNRDLEHKMMIRIVSSENKEKREIDNDFKYFDFMIIMTENQNIEEWIISLIKKMNDEEIDQYNFYRIRLKSNQFAYIIYKYMSNQNQENNYNEKDIILNMICDNKACPFYTFKIFLESQSDIKINKLVLSHSIRQTKIKPRVEFFTMLSQCYFKDEPKYSVIMFLSYD